MTRKEGFIEVEKMLKEIGVDITNCGSVLNSPHISIISENVDKVIFSFNYQSDTYFYKYNFMNMPYNELVAEELAKDYGLDYVHYDLAILFTNRGVLSKNYKKENVNYISGTEILLNFYKNNRNTYQANNLEGIWDALEYRYRNHLNKRKIIKKLMQKIVNIYIFDILLRQSDRHSDNWQIMESEDIIDIAPLYDNERILYAFDGTNYVSIKSDDLPYDNLWYSIKNFQTISSEEYKNIIQKKLWIISEENLYKVFERIERKTGYPMPTHIKKYYITQYEKHRRKIEEVLEQEDIRKR